VYFECCQYVFMFKWASYLHIFLRINWCTSSLRFNVREIYFRWRIRRLISVMITVRMYSQTIRYFNSLISFMEQLVSAHLVAFLAFYASYLTTLTFQTLLVA